MLENVTQLDKTPLEFLLTELLEGGGLDSEKISRSPFSWSVWTDREGNLVTSKTEGAIEALAVLTTEELTSTKFRQCVEGVVKGMFARALTKGSLKRFVDGASIFVGQEILTSEQLLDFVKAILRNREVTSYQVGERYTPLVDAVNRMTKEDVSEACGGDLSQISRLVSPGLLSHDFKKRCMEAVIDDVGLEFNFTTFQFMGGDLKLTHEAVDYSISKIGGAHSDPGNSDLNLSTFKYALGTLEKSGFDFSKYRLTTASYQDLWDIEDCFKPRELRLLAEKLECITLGLIEDLSKSFNLTEIVLINRAGHAEPATVLGVPVVTSEKYYLLD